MTLFLLVGAMSEVSRAPKHYITLFIDFFGLIWFMFHVLKRHNQTDAVAVVKDLSGILIISVA